MKRLFDLLFALLLLVILAVPMICVALILRASSQGPILYWSLRVGKGNVIFSMPKFRTMKFSAPEIATEELDHIDEYIIPHGAFLRKFGIDELPQLFSIVKGDMSFVGPRPALFNQDDLIELRTSKGVHLLSPGLTGWAQINGRDRMTVASKVRLDEYYLRHQSFILDLKILLLTFVTILRSEGAKD